MTLKCGIVGLPNVGKSTIFNALTQAGAQAANYPFCTIEPNVGRVELPDPRLFHIAKSIQPKKIIPAVTEFYDIAGLAEGASKGEGLGNQFLSHIRETQAIAHVVRCFSSDDVIHVKGRIHPLDDIEIIHTELALADLESLEKQSSRLQKKTRSGDKEAKELLNLAQRFLDLLNKGIPARKLELNEGEKKQAAIFGLITQLPMVYICNLDEESFSSGNDYTKEVEDHARKDSLSLVKICGVLEEQLSSLSQDEQKEYLESLAMDEPGLNRMIRVCYDLLNLITFFTAGEEEVRAWTIPKAITAPQAAGRIHSDMEKGFIRAETISYEDFLLCGSSFNAAKEKGKMRLEGKEYVVQDGDIMHFRFHV